MIVSMSMSASVLILAIALLRACALNRLPKKLFVLLWIIVLARMLIPYPFSFHQSDAVQHVPAASDHDPVIVATVMKEPFLSMETGGTTETVKVKNPRKIPFDVIWLIGAGLTALGFLLPHLRNRSIYKMSLPVQHPFISRWLAEHAAWRPIQVRSCDRIVSPLTYGVLKPVILLPKSLDIEDTEMLRFVLTHEWIHIRRHDVLLKGLLAVAVCVHWFNPLAWVMLALAARDIELSCDEAVLQKMPNRLAYAKSLLALAEKRLATNRVHAYFSKKPLEERIVVMMNMRKTSTIGALLVLVLAVGASIVLASPGNHTPHLFQHALSDEYERYKANINEVNHPRVETEDYALELKSTLFTDHHVYAIVEVEGTLPDNMTFGGQILYDNGFQTRYMLDGTDKQLESDDDSHYFLYQGIITEDWEYRKNANPMAVLAAGDFYKNHSLVFAEGSLFELTVQAGEHTHTMVSPVSNVAAEVFVLHPANKGNGLFFDKIVVTPYEMRMWGTSPVPDIGLEQIPHIDMKIVLNHNRILHFGYDESGTVSEEGYVHGHSRGTSRDGEFYHFWTFRNFTLDLNEVKKIIVNGETFRVGK